LIARKALRTAGFLLVCRVIAAAGFLLPATGPASAADERAASGKSGSPPLIERVASEWGGYLKLRGSASRPDRDSLLGASGQDALYDGNAEGLLKNALFFDGWGQLDTHYEIVLSGGDSRRERKRLGLPAVGPLQELFTAERVPNDDRRFFDLTHTISENEDAVLYHRLDRLVLTLRPDWGTLRLGRQAVTWGNGFLFNPFDLFNPFAPTDIEREYKLGDDLALVQVPFAAGANLQALYVPRRNPETDDVEWDQSALAAKLHLAWKSTEFDFMAAHNYGDIVFGAGAVGYLGGAAWRTDATWTVVDPDLHQSNYLSLTANLDYSWAGWGKNFYGFLEFFYSGIGESDYEKVFGNQALLERLARGDLFVVGRPYLSATIQVELHPLCNLFFTAINNLRDPSGVLQPRIVWDVAQDVQLLFGGTLYYGGHQTEFGGFPVPGTGLTTEAPASGYVWLSYYF
jgi:hypothetical protein